MLQRDPPGKKAITAARAEVRAQLDGLAPPLPQAALATGGTARALRKLVGRKLGEEELAIAVRLLRKRSSSDIACSFGIGGRNRNPLRLYRLILSGPWATVRSTHRVGKRFSKVWMPRKWPCRSKCGIPAALGSGFPSAMKVPLPDMT